MRLKIVSDGTPMGTQIVNEETGEPVRNVKSLYWHLTHKSLVSAVVTFDEIPLEIISDFEPRESPEK